MSTTSQPQKAQRDPAANHVLPSKVTDAEAKTFFRRYVSAIAELTGNGMSEAQQTKSANGFFGVWKELRRPLGWTHFSEAVDFVERILQGVEEDLAE